MSPVPVDPELAELLETSAARSVAAVDGLRGDVAELRRVMDRDREAAIERMARIERQVDRYGRDLGNLRDELERVDEKCGALVLEETDDDGHRTMTARPATVGIDFRTALGLFTAFAGAVIVPIVVAILTQGGP